MQIPEVSGGFNSPSRQIGRLALSEIVRIPRRPLGPLSDYVVEILPQRLKEIRSNDSIAPQVLANEILPMLLGINFDALSDDELKIAWMDLGFLEAGFVHSGFAVPVELSHALESIAVRLNTIPMLTYEGYILVNPLDEDPRLFLDELSDAEQELFFCQLHAEIEGTLKPLFEILMGLYDAPSVDRSRFEGGVEKMRVVALLMQKMNTLFSTSAFIVFRQYLASNSKRGYAGPSGAFSAAFPAIDWILLDNPMRPLPQEAAIPGLWPSRNYQKDWYVGWEDIGRAQERRHEREALFTNIEESGLTELIVELLLHLENFRKRHGAAVKKFLPAVWAGNESPTGELGEFYSSDVVHPQMSPVQAFLKSNISRVKATLDRIK